MQYSPVCGHTDSQCFDEGDRGNWADRWFHGTRVGTRVGHMGSGYPSTRVLTSLDTKHHTVSLRQLSFLFGIHCIHLLQLNHQTVLHVPCWLEFIC